MDGGANNREAYWGQSDAAQTFTADAAPPHGPEAARKNDDAVSAYELSKPGPARKSIGLMAAGATAAAAAIVLLGLWLADRNRPEAAYQPAAAAEAAEAAPEAEGPMGGVAILAPGAVSTVESVPTFPLSAYNIVAATEDFSAAINQDGRVVLIGDNRGELTTHGEDYAEPQPYYLDVSDWRNVVEISGDQFHIAGLTGSGRVICSGFDSGSGYVSGVNSWQNVTQVRTGYLQTLGLTGDGRILFAGWYKGNFHVYDCTEWTGVTRVLGGGVHVAAVLSDGSVQAAGYNGDGRCDTAQFRQDTDIIDGDLGAGSTFVVYADGTVDMLGAAAQWRGAVLGWSEVVAVSANDDHVVGLRRNGQVFYTGYSGSVRDEVESWRNIVAVAAGPHHVVGVCEDGTLVAAGENANGQCNVEGIDLWDGIAINSRQTFR
ncbi:MAG: hypothetical protein Q4C13_01225 [Clostridia bacterium]|nr:hypothetical protein [Clostridia bacterium]